MKVTFKSDTDPDFACLERHLASGSFGDLPDTWRHRAQHDLTSVQATYDMVADRLSWVSAEMKEQVAIVGDVELPTRYDSPLQYRILGNLIAQVKDAAAKVGIETLGFPHHACIPTGLVNASAVVLPEAKKAFLLFDSELLLFCHLFAKAFARCLPITSRGEMLSFSPELEGVKRRARKHGDLVEKFRTLLEVYVKTGSPSRTRPYHLEAEYVTLVELLRDGMELFVVAHEFGHVHSGHLSEFLQRLGVSSDGIFANANHRQEHEADLLGLVLTLHAMTADGFDVPLSFVGVDLFFVALELTARTEYLLAHGNTKEYADASSESHPSIQDRRAVLHMALERFVESREQVDAALKMSAAYEAIAEYLWTRSMQGNFRSRRSRRKQRHG